MKWWFGLVRICKETHTQKVFNETWATRILSLQKTMQKNSTSKCKRVPEWSPGTLWASSFLKHGTSVATQIHIHVVAGCSTSQQKWWGRGKRGVIINLFLLRLNARRLGFFKHVKIPEPTGSTKRIINFPKAFSSPSTASDAPSYLVALWIHIGCVSRK